MVEETKNILKSKTFWVNLLLILATVFGGLGELITAGTAVTVLGLANVILRAFTEKGIDWKIFG